MLPYQFAYFVTLFCLFYHFNLSMFIDLHYPKSFDHARHVTIVFLPCCILIITFFKLFLNQIFSYVGKEVGMYLD